MAKHTLYFDCSGGAAGDMICASLIDLGAGKVDEINEQLAKLKVGHIKMKSEKVMKNSVEAIHVSFEHEKQHAHRHLSTIKEIINEAGFSTAVSNDAVEVFRIIAEAEAAVHSTDIEKVHFHEVGAIDSIADIVSASYLINKLKEDKGVERVICSALPSGTGDIVCAHGTMPNPAPATAKILKDIPTYIKDVHGELVTPTGAALLKHFADEFVSGVNGVLKGSGNGAGTNDYKGSSCLLRSMLFENANNGKETAAAVVIESNIDDMSPELLSYVSDKLMENGADDVWYESIMMKKGRMAAKLCVLTEKTQHSVFTDIIFNETSTIGVRTHEVTKVKLKREEKTIETRFGKCSVKISKNDNTEKIKPEFEDVSKLARENNVTFSEVYEEAISAAKKGG